MPFASWRPLAAAAALALSLPAAHAGLFDDEEARKAILDLRARIQANDETASKAIADLAASNTQLVQQVATLQRSLLELNNQLEVLRGEVAKLRGDGEQLLRDVATLQQGQKDANQNFDDRLRKLEPQKVALDGREFVASPEERQLYDAAIAAIRNGDFDTAAKGLRLLGPHHAFIVHGDDELGALVTIHQRLCDADINVSSSNGITDGRGGYRYILHVNPEDYDRAQEVLDVDQDRRPMADYHLNLHRRFEAKS